VCRAQDPSTLSDLLACNIPGEGKAYLESGPERGASFLNDLSAVIAASDAAQRRPELFAFDHRGKHRWVTAFFNMATPAQERCNDV